MRGIRIPIAMSATAGMAINAKEKPDSMIIPCNEFRTKY
jgi:hypothetical protein